VLLNQLLPGRLLNRPFILLFPSEVKQVSFAKILVLNELLHFGSIGKQLLFTRFN